MHGMTSSRTLARFALLATAICLSATLASPAVAGCGRFEPPATPSTMDDSGLRPSAAGLMPALYRPGAASFVRVSDDERRDRGYGIVGMWRITMVSDGTAYPVPIPYGAVVDFGTQQWHSDGTEILVSGGRAPSTGDVCMGVWEQVGHRTYRLKHFAMSYASSDTPTQQGGPVVPAAYVGPGIIRETVTVSPSGKSFEGTFTIDQYAKDEVTLVQHIAGKITGTRFMVD